LDVIEIDAASNTGVDNIRDLIEKAQFAPVQCRYKVYVIDECHMLSTAAFNALLKTLEEPPDRVVFVLATTDPQRVLPTIISRCQRFDFRRIPLDSMIRHLSTIAAKETIDIVNPAITLVAQLAQGGLRDAESLLDQLSLLPPPVTPEAVWDLVGAVPERDLLALVKAIVADDPEALLDRARELMNRGREPLIVLQHLASFYRDLLIAKTAPQRGDMVAVTEETWQEMVVVAKTLPIGTLLQGQQSLRSSESQLKNTTQPRLWLEVTLLGLLPSALVAATPSPTAGVVSVSAAMPATATPTTYAQTTHAQTAYAQSVAPSIPQTVPQALPQQVPQGTANWAVSTVDGISSNGSDVLNHSGTTTIASPSVESSPQVVHISPAEQDCVSLWERTLARTRTASAKGLFSQQAQLIAFSGTQAIVAVRPKLLKLAETKLAPIQEAMSQVVGYNVTIRLQPTETIAPPPSASEPITTAPPVTPAAASVTTTTTTPTSTTPTSTTPTSTTTPYTPSPVYESPTPPPPLSTPPPTSLPPTQPTPLPTPPLPHSPLPTPQESFPTPQPLAQVMSATPMTQVWNEDEALRAAKNVAQFFNGEVVHDSETIAEPDLSGGEEDNTPF
jgi:DNA polymerase-3 subunit gamma/tau